LIQQTSWAISFTSTSGNEVKPCRAQSPRTMHSITVGLFLEHAKHFFVAVEGIEVFLHNMQF